MTNHQLDIIYQDSSVIITNKPPGLLTVPGRGPDKQDCLATRMLKLYPNSRVVHRLDQPTSGLVVFPQSYEALRNIAKQFETRKVEKRYIAVVTGLVEEDTGSVDLPLICDWPNRPRQMVDYETGKQALTHFTVLKRSLESHTSRICLKPVTGRSHQLRVHMQQIGHPIVGDTLYSQIQTREPGKRMLLHAEHIAFCHPDTQELIEFTLPAEF